MAGKFMATVWAVAGGVLLLAAFALVDANIMFAMMGLGLAIACLLVAAACLLKPSARSIDRAARKDSDEPPAQRPRWGPR